MIPEDDDFQILIASRLKIPEQKEIEKKLIGLCEENEKLKKTIIDLSSELGTSSLKIRSLQQKNHYLSKESLKMAKLFMKPILKSRDVKCAEASHEENYQPQSKIKLDPNINECEKLQVKIFQKSEDRDEGEEIREVQQKLRIYEERIKELEKQKIQTTTMSNDLQETLHLLLEENEDLRKRLKEESKQNNEISGQKEELEKKLEQANERMSKMAEQIKQKQYKLTQNIQELLEQKKMLKEMYTEKDTEIIEMNQKFEWMKADLKTKVAEQEMVYKYLYQQMVEKERKIKRAKKVQIQESLQQHFTNILLECWNKKLSSGQMKKKFEEKESEVRKQISQIIASLLSQKQDQNLKQEKGKKLENFIRNSLKSVKPF